MMSVFANLELAEPGERVRRQDDICSPSGARRGGAARHSRLTGAKRDKSRRGGRKFSRHSMQYNFFSIPAVDCDVRSFEDELNGFLRGHRILSVKRELLCDGPQSRWCICVEYLDGLICEIPERDNWPRKERIDYREILSEEEFARFAKMRASRKTLAEEDHIPAYAIMMDERMAELAKLSYPLPPSFSPNPIISLVNFELASPRNALLWIVSGIVQCARIRFVSTEGKS